MGGGELLYRGPWLPHSESIAEFASAYYANGWHLSDVRAERGLALALRRGHVTDYDIMDAQELRTHPFYAEFILPAGLQWFAATAIRVGGKVWAFALQRAAGQDPFQGHELRRLAELRTPLRLALRRAHALAYRRVETLEDVYSATTHGFLTLDPMGRVNSLNQAAETLLSEAGMLRNGQLMAEAEPGATALRLLLDAALGRASMLPPPLQIAPSRGPRLVIDAIPMPRDFNTLLTGAVAIVTVRPSMEETHSAVLQGAFGLTGRELQIAEMLALGRDLSEIAQALGLSVATVRQHLKAAFRKTNTHRQAELVTLMAKHTRFP